MNFPTLRTCCSFILLLLSPIAIFAQNGLSFDGGNDYVQSTYYGPTGTKSRTIEAWFQTAPKKGQGAILDYGTSSSGNSFNVSVSGGYVKLDINGSSNSGTVTVSDGNWHHVAVCYDDTASLKYRIYIDGKVTDSFNMSSTLNTGNSTALRIGQSIGGSDYFNGLIDEVRVWGYPRSHRQIRQYYMAELCAHEPGLELYYKFNEGVAEKSNPKIKTVPDLSGRGNDGALQNFTLSGSTSNWVKGVKMKIGANDVSISATACSQYRSPSGKSIWRSSGTYNDTIPSFMGCDSAITVKLTITPNPTKTIHANSCGPYTSPSGNFTWSKSGTYSDRIPQGKGCDTLVTVHLKISEPTLDTVAINFCGKYTSPSGKHIWTQSGDYYDTLRSYYGCDSILLVKLRDLSSHHTLSVDACKSYTSPSGKYTWTIPGLYSDTLSNYRKCDSVIIINLSISQTVFSDQKAFDCHEFVSPSGKHVWTSSGVYSDTIPSVGGCDSIINIRLKIGGASHTMDVSTCEKYLSPSGRHVWTTSGKYYDTLPTPRGCDSIITINLDIKKNKVNTTTLTTCNEYRSPSGRYLWTTSGTYRDTLPGSNGCDSILMFNLTITPLNTKVTQSGSKLTAAASGVSYEWLNCSKGYAPVDGANGQSFTATEDGEYAVRVYNNDCSDTSECILLENVGIGQHAAHALVEIYPNPNYGQVQIQLNQPAEDVSIEVRTVTGKLVLADVLHSGSTLLELPAQHGVYLLTIKSPSGIETHQLVRLEE